MKIVTLLLCLSIFFLQAEEKKVALLFLTRSDLNHSQLWQNWIDPEKYNVYNHSKTPVQDPWFAQFRIAETQPNEWGWILLAEQALLKAALQNPENCKFVFLSESCVPIRTTDQVYDFLTADDCSYMRWHELWWHGNQARTLSEFPEANHLGNQTWMILNRRHAEMMAYDDYWIHLAHPHLAADEAYPSTFFCMQGVLHEFKNQFTTFVDWQRGGPYVIREATQENFDLLLDARRNPNGPFEPRSCLFARKIGPEFPDELLSCIQNDQFVSVPDPLPKPSPLGTVKKWRQFSSKRSHKHAARLVMKKQLALQTLQKQAKSHPRVPRYHAFFISLVERQLGL